jgi:hypothetical protein
MTRHFFYYIRGRGNAPIVTVCLLVDTTATGEVDVSVPISRGIAICSAKDNVLKKEGRRKALAQARKAYGLKYSSEHIVREEAWDVISDVMCIDDDFWLFKSRYSANLTALEKKLLCGE